jgi:hypothetical protein
MRDALERRYTVDWIVMFIETVCMYLGYLFVY